MAGEGSFSAKITNLVGGATIDQEFCDDACIEACKEIIYLLPPALKAKCSTVSTLDNNATTLDIDGKGEILHVTRLSADSGGYQLACREIPSIYGGVAEDSTNLNYYGTVTDPVYWVDSSSDVSTLKVKPTTTATQTAIVHHITYPSVDVSAVNTIANFPDEAEYLVVIYAAMRQLLKFMSAMSADFNDDIEDAFSRAKTLMTDDTAFNALDSVTDDVTNVSALYQLGQEDSELVGATLSLVATELQRAGALIGADGQKYQWYADQYTRLSADWARGILALQGQGQGQGA